MTNAILRGKPDAGNPHVRFDEGEVASAKPRRGSLLYTQNNNSWRKTYFTLLAGQAISFIRETLINVSLAKIFKK